MRHVFWWLLKTVPVSKGIVGTGARRVGAAANATRTLPRLKCVSGSSEFLKESESKAPAGFYSRLLVMGDDVSE